MNINPANNAAYAYTYNPAAGEPAARRTPGRAQQLQTALNKINRKYPNLDRDLAKALVVEREIENSDTWEGLKWYEMCLPAIAIKGNKIMKMVHREKVEKLQNLVTARDTIRAALACL